MIELLFSVFITVVPDYLYRKHKQEPKNNKCHRK